MPRSTIDANRRASRAGSRRRWPSYRRSKLESSTFSLIESALRRVLMEKSKNVIDPAASAEAALSHTLPQQAEDFTASEFDTFDQAHQHPHVGQHRRTRETRFVEHHAVQPQFDGQRRFRAARLAGRRRWFEIRRREIRRRGGRRERLALAAGVAAFLRPSSVRRAVVRGAPLVGALPAAVLSATERTTQVPPACVAGMREKANPAVLAVNNALLKSGMGLQNRIQRRLILPDNRLGAIVLMPIHLEREKLLDGDDKKARLSVIIPIELDTPSSYPIDAKASRSRARFFLR